MNFSQQFHWSLSENKSPRVTLLLLLLRVFHYNLSDSLSPLVFRTLLSILANLNNAVIQILPPFSNCFNPLSKPLGTVPRTPTTLSITVIHMFHISFSSLAKSRYLLLYSFFSTFLLMSEWKRISSGYFIIIIIIIASFSL